MMHPPGYRRSNMAVFGRALTAALMLSSIASLAPAQQAPLQDKPFAEHRIVAAALG